MREVLVKLLGFLYRWVKSSRYFRGLYYQVANAQFFTNLQMHEKMLADNVRVDAYYRAIAKHVKEGDAVADLGTGTGILAFFAAARTAGPIYAIEHGNIIGAAARAAAHNGITSIQFVNVHSKEFRAPAKLDVILHEQMGAVLFDERMVENIVDLRDRVLKEGGRILPARFELFIEPVKIVDEEHIPFIWEQNVHAVRFDCFADMKSNVNGDYGYRYIKPSMVEYLLCEPEAVLKFDLETVKPGEIPREIRYRRRINRDGRLNGFCVYFNAAFDEEIGFSTSPMAGRTCWSNPLLRAESREFKKGDSIEFRLLMEDPGDITTYRWSYT